MIVANPRHRVGAQWLVALALLGASGCEDDNPVGALDRVVVRIEVTPGTADVAIAGTLQLQAQGLNAAGEPVTQGTAFAWATSNNAVATVNAGRVIGVATGTVTIGASCCNTTGLATVRVLAAGRLEGRVIDGANGNAIVGASVRVLEGTIQRELLSSDAQGAFTSNPLVARDVVVTAAATGYNTVTVYGITIAPGATTPIEPIVLVREATTPGVVAGTIRNARNNEPVANATVTLIRGINGTSPVIGTAHTVPQDMDGRYRFNDVEAGTYTLRVVAGGFAPGARTGVSVGNFQVVDGQDFALSPVAGVEDDVRIVLTWGDDPSDLDSHLTGPLASGSRFHIYYSSRGQTSAEPFAALDLDDTTGRGPETITVSRRTSGQVYRYSVHDFTNRLLSNSSALGRSRAKVEVFHGTDTPRVFFVPSGVGTLWTVFHLSASLEIIPINTLTNASDPAGIQKAMPADAERIARTARGTKLP